MRCQRCGTPEGSGPSLRPPVQVDTVAIRVNDTVENLRVPLCGECRAGLAETVSRFLASGPLMVPA